MDENIKIKVEKRCEHCGHLMSKHPRPRHLVGYGEWDYYNHKCGVKNCNCNISCFGQLLNEDGTVIKKKDLNVGFDE